MTKVKYVRAVSQQALRAVIARRKLEPINGEYHFTTEMLEEAAREDDRCGRNPPPDYMKLEDE